jgi:phage gpG-like protein
MANLTITLDSHDLNSDLSRMAGRFGTLKPFFEIVWPILHRSVLANFRAGGRPAKWPPLSEATIEARKQRGTWGGSQPILQEYGKLRQSIGTVFRISHTTLEYGTNDRRAAWLQFGTSRRSRQAAQSLIRQTTPAGVRIRTSFPARSGEGGRLPARPFLLFQVEDVTRITAMAAAYAWGDRR